MSFGSKSLPAATEDQQARFEIMKEIGCVCCILQGRHKIEPEIHHLLSGGRRRGHWQSIALCQWHHRAIIPQGQTRESMTALYGPSLADGSKPFNRHHGSDDELLEAQNKLLSAAGFHYGAQPDYRKRSSKTSSKIVPHPGYF